MRDYRTFGSPTALLSGTNPTMVGDATLTPRNEAQRLSFPWFRAAAYFGGPKRADHAFQPTPSRVERRTKTRHRKELPAEAKLSRGDLRRKARARFNASFLGEARLHKYHHAPVRRGAEG